MLTHRRRDDTGSALMLMPAGVLVLLLLASLALDTAVVWLGQRELANAAAAAANDVAAIAIDETTFYADGTVRIDARRADAIAHSHARAAHDTPLGEVRIDRLQVSGTRVEVTLSATVAPIIGLPWRDRGRQVRASAVATAVS